MITIYGRNGCPYCDDAKELAEQKGIPYKYNTLNIDYDRDYLVGITGIDEGLTVPQIFNGGTLIGGYADFLVYVTMGDGNE